MRRLEAEMNLTTTHGTQQADRAALVRNLAQLFGMVADGGVEQSSATSERNGASGKHSACYRAWEPPESIIAQVPENRINLVESEV